MLTHVFVSYVFALPLLLAAYTDYASMRIPNWVCSAMMAGFFLTLPFTWGGFAWFAEHLAVGGVFFAFGLAVWSLGLLGGGDAKLMAATGLWFGWADTLPYILYTSLFGAVIGLALLFSPKILPQAVLSSTVGTRLFQGGKDMPYALALAGGALFVWPVSDIGLTLAGLG